MDNIDINEEPIDDSILYAKLPNFPGIDNLLTATYMLTNNYAYVEIFFVNPTFDTREQVLIIEPEKDKNGNLIEFVYPIYDYGFKISTYKVDSFTGMSMCKLYFTIEKMIKIIVDKLNEGGIIGTGDRDKDSDEEQITVAFGGHPAAQRKAFESIINLKDYFIVVNNFHPGEWGELYLKNIKTIADKGYGYPEPSPRSNYRTNTTNAMKRRDL